MKNKLVKDVAVVTAGNVIFMLANILAGFLLPLLISVEDYGYYKIYTLYSSYSGLLHFGFIDGIYLEYSGKSYNELDKKQFRVLSLFMIILEIVLAIIIALLSVIFLKSEYMIIGIFVAMGLIVSNIGQYYQYVAQALSEFTKFSKRKIYNALGVIASLGVLLIYNHTVPNKQSTYSMYIILTLVVHLILTLWFVFSYKDITFGNERNSFKSEKMTIISLLKKGIIMTIAYEASRMVLLIDRQFVSMLFSVTIYAEYSFAYNILSCVTNVIVGISTVLFPKLKNMSIRESATFFPKYMSLLTIIVSFFLTGYYPVVWIVRCFLPNYAESLVYFKIIFPLLALSGCITIIIFSYYQIYDKIKIFLYSCIVTLIFSVITNVIAYSIFHTAEAISFASVFTTIIWYIISIIYLSKHYKIRWCKNFIYTIVMILTFYVFVFGVDNPLASIAGYLLSFIIFTYLFNMDIINNSVEAISNRLHS